MVGKISFFAAFAALLAASAQSASGAKSGAAALEWAEAFGQAEKASGKTVSGRCFVMDKAPVDLPAMLRAHRPDLAPPACRQASPAPHQPRMEKPS